MSDRTCASCGRAVEGERHAEEWRDRGHRPQIIRELDPERENTMRTVMRQRPRP